MKKTERRLADRKIIGDLIRTAVTAAERQHYFEASIIIFQTVEGLLRIAIKVFGEAHGASKATLEKCADNETSFWRLVLHFDMIHPDNALGQRLLALNARRNKIMHRLFYDFDSLEHLEDELKAFCKEAMALNMALQESLETTKG
jgi:hypothetical protein